MKLATDNPGTPPTIEAIQKSFEKELNLHGYGFQFSVLEKAHKQAEFGHSRWAFSVAEFPVEVQGSGTKIDFVLIRRLSQFDQAVMICECKRANPAYSNWCFIKSPYTHRGQRGKVASLIIESAMSSTDGIRVFAYSESYTREVFHLAVPVKVQAKGDDKPIGQYRSQIEEAATQVMRGLNGYIEMLSHNPQLTPPGQEKLTIRFLPVIFTTASLWISESNLASARLENGEVDLRKDKFGQVPWLWYQYNVSPGLKHSQVPLEKKLKVEDLMRDEYIRSIAVVSASGVAEFLEETTDFL